LPWKSFMPMSTPAWLTPNGVSCRVRTHITSSWYHHYHKNQALMISMWYVWKQPKEWMRAADRIGGRRLATVTRMKFKDFFWCHQLMLTMGILIRMYIARVSKNVTWQLSWRATHLTSNSNSSNHDSLVQCQARDFLLNSHNLNLNKKIQCFWR
jgi:hypothetical protein